MSDTQTNQQQTEEHRGIKYTEGQRRNETHEGAITINETRGSKTSNTKHRTLDYQSKTANITQAQRHTLYTDTRRYD